MTLYRVYFLGLGGHIDQPPRIIEAANDEAAATAAKQFIGALDVEVWDGKRCIVKYARKVREPNCP